MTILALNLVNNIIQMTIYIIKTNRSLLPLLLLTLPTLFLAPTNATTQNCLEHCLSTEDSSCHICYKQCNSTNELISCHKLSHQCIINNIPFENCNQSQPLDSSQCSDRCCSEEVQKLKIEGFSSCYPDEWIRDLTIIIGVFSTLIIVVLVFCMLIKMGCCKLSLFNCCLKTIGQIQPEAGESPSINDLEGIVARNENNEANKKKLQKQNQTIFSPKLSKYIDSSTLQSSNCSICLSPEVNAITNCNHFFHLHCIYEWCIRNNKCPLCKNKKIMSKIILKCCICKKNSKILEDVDNINKIKIMELRHWECDNCKIGDLKPKVEVQMRDYSDEEDDYEDEDDYEK